MPLPNGWRVPLTTDPSGRVYTPVLAKRSAGGRAGHDLAGLAQADAQRRIARIRGQQHQLVVALSADLAHRQDGVASKLALERDEVLLRVRRLVLVPVADRAVDRRIPRPVARVRVLRRDR